MEKDNIANIDLFAPTVNNRFRAYIDGPDQTYKTIRVIRQMGRILIVSVRDTKSAYITFNIVIRTTSTCINTDEISIEAIAPGEGLGRFDGPLTLLQSLSEELAATVMAAVTSNKGAKTADYSAAQRSAALDALNLVYDMTSNCCVTSGEHILNVLTQYGIVIKKSTNLDGRPTLEVVSAEGVFGGIPFNYLFAKGSDWEIHLEWFLKKL